VGARREAHRGNPRGQTCGEWKQKHSEKRDFEKVLRSCGVFGHIATGTGKKTPGGIGAVPRPPVRPCVSRLPRPFLNRETWWDFGNHGKYVIVCELFAAFRTAAVHHHGSRAI
jgi:hypothetical protein